jgi:hypothetical protein
MISAYGSLEERPPDLKILRVGKKAFLTRAIWKLKYEQAISVVRRFAP